MSGARRRSKSLWDNKEEAMPQRGKKDFDSSFHGHGDTSNSEAIDVLMSDDFSHDPTMLQPNENIPYRGGNRDRSRSPHRNRTRDRGGDERERRESYESGDMRNDSRASSHSHRQHGGSRFHDDRNKDSDSYRKDNDYHQRDRGNNNSMKPPCRFFMMGNCNRTRCKFSHDAPKTDGYEERSHDNNSNDRPQDYSSRNLDDKNKSWNDLEYIGNQESQQHIHHSYEQDFIQSPITLNGVEKSPDMNGGGKVLEASRNGIPTENVASKEQVPSSPEKQILANALELLYSLPNPGAPVTEPVGILSDSKEQGNQIPVESKQEENEKKKDENENLKNTGKNEKVEEGDEKAMRQFKIVLVEFVKEILKPTWKEGKMSREVYKTIVKKVVEKVSSSIQGVQIPRTQEKIDQYLAFSKPKITKLVEAYVGRLQKA